MSEQLRAKRLQRNLTQEGLANRAGIPLPTLRKFEQKGLISLESFLKLLTVLGCLEDVVRTLKADDENFRSIKDVLKSGPQKSRKRGRRS